MIPVETILEYIRRKYDPLSIILYGSYANGTNNRNSDFDALVISGEHERFHDTSFVEDVQLDVFVYPASFFEGDFNCEDFVQIFDGRILVDCDDRGKRIQQKVLAHMQNRPLKSQMEIEADVDWCIKMLARAKRHDAEGCFRWHWVLTDSLEIFCDVMRHPYLGPKKTLKWLGDNHPDAFACYKTALEDFRLDSLENWVAYISELNSAAQKRE